MRLESGSGYRDPRLTLKLEAATAALLYLELVDPMSFVMTEAKVMSDPTTWVKA